ncbi:MAG: hypothetical protein AAGJ83_07880, partial [Planctomycetota bacterium]
PSRMTRQFDEAKRIAVHTFEFSDPIDAETISFRVTDRDHETAGALRQQGEPLLIDVSDSSDFIRIGRQSR